MWATTSCAAVADEVLVEQNWLALVVRVGSSSDEELRLRHLGVPRSNVGADQDEDALEDFDDCDDVVRGVQAKASARMMSSCPSCNGDNDERIGDEVGRMKSLVDLQLSRLALKENVGDSLAVLGLSSRVHLNSTSRNGGSRRWRNLRTAEKA